MSLRTRISLAAAGAVAVIAILLGAIGYFPTRARLVDQVRAQLQERAATLVNSRGDRDGSGQGGPGNGSPGNGSPGNGSPPNGGPGGGGPDGGGAFVAGCDSQGDLRITAPEFGGTIGYIQSVCASGKAVAGDGGTPQLPVTKQVLDIARAGQGSAYFSAHVHGTHVEILAVADPRDSRVVEVALPLTEVDSALHGLVVNYLVLIGIGVLLAAGAGLLIARTAVAPVIHAIRKTELARRSLVADASHELRTPMAALRSNVQIFLDADRLPAGERVELQQAIMAELDDLTQVVGDVLELARGDEPTALVEAVELDAVVREAIERAERRTPSVEFSVDLAPTVIENVSERVSRAVSNVIDNARKWSPPGDVIEVSLHDGLLTVRDHGPGFDEADVDHVFDRFYRSPHARRSPGSGLGLAIVKQAAEARGGFAAATNALDGGAIVRVAFEPKLSSPRDPRRQVARR